MPATKIATCCYCGTKAALVLRGTELHELTCSSCGAPLHAMKKLPVEAAPPAKRKKSDKVASEPRRAPKKKKSKRRKVASKLWDILEDVADEILD